MMPIAKPEILQMHSHELPREPLSRRERRHLEVRCRILEATVVLLQQHNLANIAVEHICMEADVARKTFYNYFANKKEVIFALCDDLLFQRSEKLVREAVADTSTNMAQFLSVYLQQAVENFTRYSAVDRKLIAQVMGESLASERVQQHSSTLHAGFSEIVRRGQAMGDIQAGFSAEFYATVILSSINGIVARWASDGDYPISEQLHNLGRFLQESIGQ